MKYKEMALENGELVEKSCKEIDASKLTSDCWLIQFSGLEACDTCEYLDTEECGGEKIRLQRYGIEPPRKYKPIKEDL